MQHSGYCFGSYEAGYWPQGEILVPDLTFIATAIRLCGANVKLVDIDPITFNLDVEKVKQNISPKTRSIVTFDVNGKGA